MPSPLYILGTGLSHNGSAVLLKNGKVCVAIEKERLSTIKHDGGNDTLAIEYCLKAAGITLKDIELVVQCANFDIPDRNYFRGKRIFAHSDKPEMINISHHLAHAYSAVGTSPFNECMVMVIDGCGSPLHQFLTLHPEQKEILLPEYFEKNEMYCEKDSFYYFNGQRLITLFKDFSEMAVPTTGLSLPTTKHSIGGFYALVSNYIFGNMEDAGKLMGLAPYGKSEEFNFEAFEFKDERIFLNNSWSKYFNNPSTSYEHFKIYFNYYANVANWAQKQVEKALLYYIQQRLKKFPHENLCYSGGVALNAVANAKLLNFLPVENIYFEPAAGDNGLALGCAYYGYLDYLNKPKIRHNGTTCFGKQYTPTEISCSIKNAESKNFASQKFTDDRDLLFYAADALKNGKTVGWFYSGCEFGPRSLGRRSILAHPGWNGLKDKINRQIKFREDFRPFAPAVLKEMANEYFVNGNDSPYMILVDKTKPEHLTNLKNVTHCDGSARVQTVDKLWNPKFYNLIEIFYQQTGIGVLLNTSLNKRGMPIAETPQDAIRLFEETAMDLLVLEDFVLEKTNALSSNEILNKILAFLKKINMVVVETSIEDPCFLPGLEIKENAIFLDRQKLKYPGDLLHEAGHLAVTPAKKRLLIGTEKMQENWPENGDEIAAILWSYAAIKHLQLPPEVVFHPDGYKNDSQWLIQEFKNGNYIGLPLLEWMGLCNGSLKSQKENTEEFPAMLQWLR